MADEAFPTGKELEKKLHKGKLPQMVDWFDPLVLGLVAVRTLISTTIGRYADQRPMQQIMVGDATDIVTRRHDYSVLWGDNAVLAPESDRGNPNFAERYNGSDEPRILKLHNKALWVDF